MVAERPEAYALTNTSYSGESSCLSLVRSNDIAVYEAISELLAIAAYSGTAAIGRAAAELGSRTS